MKSLLSTRNKLSKRLEVYNDLLRSRKGPVCSNSITKKGEISSTGRSSSVLLEPFTFAGKGRVKLLGKLVEVKAVSLEDTVPLSSQALLLQISTFSFHTDNKYVALPSYSKDVHKILLYGDNARDHLSDILRKAGSPFPEGQTTLCGVPLESRNVMLWVSGSIGLHSSYVAKYKKKISEPCIHVFRPLDRLTLVSSDI